MGKFKRGQTETDHSKSDLIFIGIDPGAIGAIAFIDPLQNIIQLRDWPGDELQAAQIVILGKLMCGDSNLKGAIEKVHSMPGQGVRSMFSFGTNFGIWRGILATLEIPFLLPAPQTWQKGILHKAQDQQPKLAAAGRMFPGAELYGPRGGGKDGRADALLIADWCRRQFV